MHLAHALGKTLAELRSTLPSSEYQLQWTYYKRFGFVPDRLCAGIALSGLYAANSNGAKLQPRHLVPKFGEDEPQDPTAINIEMTAWAAQVNRIREQNRKLAG